MEAIDWLKSISDDIAHVQIEESNLQFICPHKESHGQKIRLLIKIINPRNQQELRELIKEDNFVFNRGDYINVLKDYNTYDYALCKNQGFDTAFTAMKFLKPKLTECDFVFTCGYNIDGVDGHDKDLATAVKISDINQDALSEYIQDDDGSLYIFRDVDTINSSISEINISISLKNVHNNRDILGKIILLQK